MAKIATFRVINNRMQFRCPKCGAKRNFPVQGNIRKKNMRCHKCGEVIRCVLNRRTTPRQRQSGLATLITNDGKEISVNIHDISADGIGIEIPVTIARARTIKKGQKIRFHCKWNPRLLGSGYFIVINSSGQRIGVKKVTTFS